MTYPSIHYSAGGVPRGLNIKASRERSMTSGEISFDEPIRTFLLKVDDKNNGSRTNSLEDQFTVHRDNDNDNDPVAISVAK